MQKGGKKREREAGVYLDPGKHREKKKGEARLPGFCPEEGRESRNAASAGRKKTTEFRGSKVGGKKKRGGGSLIG